MSSIYRIKLKVSNKYLCEDMEGVITFSKFRGNARSFLTKEETQNYIEKKKLMGLKYVIDEWKY